MCLKIVKSRKRACPIRVFAPSSLPLSDESVSFINGLTKSTRDAHVYALSRLHAWGPQSISHVDGADQQNETSDIVVFQQTVKGKQFAKDIDALKLREEVLPNAMLWSSFTRADQSTAVVPRKESIPRRLLTIMHTNASISSDRLRSTLSRQAKEEAALTALQALFHSEYLLMAEYIEFTLPIPYAAYLATIFHLPVASYYPQTMSLTSQSLARTVATIIAYAAVEFVGFVGLVFLLRRKFGISPLHQLAFAFETQAWALQGHLFVWTIFILHLRLEHYGVDFDVNLNF
ncbi:hypothetical protein PF008_g11258 [Phytophthora fragariae]|uniref:Uncharacterized protein n=1 Tax=Phytophthora fragariae TaxID=53985 RepID=A0A6G0RSW4_9STRA|nr:hypothetical protein PF008_g11258 [Phytophthora fragariae]